MGKRLRTYIKEPSIFFVTTTFTDWKNLLVNAEILDKAETLLFSVMSAKASAIFGYVLMPSHVHLLIGCSLGGLQLSECMRSYKSLTARKIFPTIKSVWMRRFDDLVIVTEKQFYVKLNYIHDNPVRKGLVKEAVDWKWSSAQFWINDEEHPVLKKDWDWTTL
jgi:putative transposase